MRTHILRTHLLSRAIGVGVFVMSSMAVLACSSDATDPTSPPSSHIYWALRFNWNAVNLALTALYNAVQLTATPFDAAGDTLRVNGAVPVVQYSTADSSVTVSATGRVTAQYITGSTQVVAKATINGITQTDTATIQVTDSALAAPLATLSIQPHAGELDSAKISVDRYDLVNQGNGNIPVYATIATGNPVTDTVCSNTLGCPLLLHWTSSDPTVVSISQSGYIGASRPGHTVFTVSTWAYGVGKRTTLPFTIGYLLSRSITVNATESEGPLTPFFASNADSITIGVGGTVRMSNAMTRPLQIELSGPAQQIRILLPDPTYPHQVIDTIPGQSGPSGFRAFLRVVFDSAGTYPFRCTVLDQGGKTCEGTIVVSAGP